MQAQDARFPLTPTLSPKETGNVIVTQGRGEGERLLAALD